MGKERPFPTKPLNIISAPVIYINDSSESDSYVRQLAEHLPLVYTTTFDTWRSMSRSKRSGFGDRLVLVGDRIGSENKETKLAHIRTTQDLVTKSHFVSIDIINDELHTSTSADVKGDHLCIQAGHDTAVKVYQWLFSVLTTREMLFIIPESEMLEINEVNWPKHKYCRLLDVKKTPKNIDVQCVVLIATKPQVTESKIGKCLRWEVIDNSASAHFVFHWRGPESQNTWDWAQKFTPGQRVALGRRSLVQVKEKKSSRFIKGPSRAASALLSSWSSVLHGTANVLSKGSRKLNRGSGSQWVSKSDIGTDGKIIDWKKVNETHDQETMRSAQRIKVFNEKGNFVWSDGASVASTDVGDDLDEKQKL